MATGVAALIDDHRVNAWLSWALVGFLLVASTTSIIRGDYLWAGFSLVVAVLAVLPPVALRNRYAMIPWEVTVLTALPILGGAFASVELTSNLATYLSVAAMALVVAVELHLFTSVRMNDAFALLFVVVATLAAAGAWAVVRWLVDLALGTGFLLDPALDEATIEHGLMLEFVASTVAGVLAGLFFAFYVRRKIDRDERIPTEGTRV